MARNFRTLFKHLLPGWLTEDGDGPLVLHSLATIKDALIQRVRSGLESRLPSRSGPSALALTGADRGIPRGREESDAHYAARLLAWRYPRGHRVRGNAFALLEQISEYFGGVHCWTIDVRGTLDARTADGTESTTYGVPWDWDGAPPSPRWGRFWIGVEPVPQVSLEAWPPLGDPACWDGYTLGQAKAAGIALGHKGISSRDVGAVRRLFTGRAWKPAGTRQQFAIVALTDHAVNVFPVPDGNWDTWQGRDPALRYWNLYP